MLHTEPVLLFLASRAILGAFVSDISVRGFISVHVSVIPLPSFWFWYMPIYIDYAYIHTLSPFGPGSPGGPTCHSKKNEILFTDKYFNILFYIFFFSFSLGH